MSNYVRSMLFGVVLLVAMGSARAGIDGTWRHLAYEVDTMLHWSSLINASGALNGTMNYEEILSDDDDGSGTVPLTTVFHERGGVTVDVGGGEEIWNLYRNLAEDVMGGIGVDEEDELVALKLFVQPATNHSAADLGGRWHVRRLLFEPGAPAFVGYGKAEGSLNGMMTSRWEYSPMETAEKELVVSSTITAAGVVSLTVRVPVTGARGELEDFSYTGYMNASRDVIISTSAPNDAEANWNLLVLVKQAAAYSRADLAGTWAMAQMWIGPDGMDDAALDPEYAGYSRGIGALNGRFNIEEGGDVYSGWRGERDIVGLKSFVYSDGQVKMMPLDGGAPLSGQMNASKNVIVCADNADGDVNYSVFVKVSEEGFGGFTYSVAGGKATVTGYDGAGVAVVPATYNGVPVTAIADGAFADNPWLFNVVMPASMTRIGAEAFRGCVGLEWLAMPAGLQSIGAGAFNDCDNLEAIFFNGGRPTAEGALGSSATGGFAEGNPGWGQSAGEWLGGLAVMRINYAPESDFETYEIPNVGVSLTRYKGNAEYVNVPPTIGGKPVVILGNDLFAYRPEIRLLILPENLREIGRGSVATCENLRTVILPSTLQSIGEYALEDNESLLYVDIPEGVAQLEPEVFLDCSRLVSVSMPSTINYIGDFAFSGCSLLGSMSIPAPVMYIGDGAFMGCNSLVRFIVDAENDFFASTADGVLCDKALTTLIQYPAGRLGPYAIPASVTGIAPWAFHSARLQSIDIGATIVAIGAGAFALCDELQVINVAATNAQFSSVGGVLFSKDGTALLQYPGGVAGAYSVPAGVTHIGAFAFAGCWRLSGIELGSSVQTIGVGAFAECMALREVALPAGLQRIEESTFESCHSLQNVPIPPSVTVIGESAFEDCYSLRQIVIPEGVLSIGPDAFDNCVQLQAIVVPDSVTELGEGAFAECERLATAVLGRGVTVIPYDCFYGCSSLREVTIHGALTEIGEYAFIYCQSLPNFVVPATVTMIDTFAFWDCPSLASVEFMGPAPQIGWRPFPVNLSSKLYYWVTQPGWDALDGSWDVYVNQLEGRVRTFRVVFDIGAVAQRVGGGALEQIVEENQMAVPPDLQTVGPAWTLREWEPQPGVITADATYRALYAYHYELPGGWDLIGAPLQPRAEQVYDNFGQGLTGFDAAGRQYVHPNIIAVGKAYWIFTEADEPADLLGYSPSDSGLNELLPAGWNFVSPALPVAGLPQGVEAAWEWTGQTYQMCTQIVPGRGYWLYQSQQ